LADELLAVALARAPKSSAVKSVSIEYHDVVDAGALDSSGFPGPGPGSYKLDADLFERHLEAIARVVSAHAGTVMDALSARSTPAPSVYFTFDDGGTSAATIIGPMLERFGWRGHFFVTTDRIGTPAFLTADRMQDLVARGHVIGSHSCSHPSLMARCSDLQLRDEWRRSAEVLQEILRVPTLTASVPGGLYSPRVARAAAKAGIRALFTSQPITRTARVDGCLVLGRFTMRRRTPPERAAAIAAGRVSPRLREWIVRKVLSAARAAGGPLYLSIRSAVFARRGTD
jgi:peptidoglycan/xylan/chitin deacetylase (PgdA/CDA1 family)